MRLAPVCLALCNCLALGFAHAGDHYPDRDRVDHVVLLSVDGLHALDVERYIAANPASTLARLAARGVRYTNASSSRPSDSFPGLLALVTGGSPFATGVFYDVSYDRTQWSPGNGGCSGAAGNVTTYDETIDLVVNGVVQNRIDPNLLPWGYVKGRCERVYPHDFVRVNTIFEVVRARGGRTAWADKHPAYDLVNGPSGKGVDDLYTPEITSPVDGGPDYTAGVLCAAENDALKVQAVINEIRGRDATGRQWVGIPALMGMNFQAVSVGQKIAANKTKDFCKAFGSPEANALEGLRGGYQDGTGTPSKVLAAALDGVDQSLRRIVEALKEQGIYERTLLVLSAKHGQAPIDPLQVKKPGHLQDLVAKLPDAATSPAAAAIASAAVTDDDVALIWLQDGTQADAVAAYLRSNAGVLGIQDVLSGAKLKLRFRDPQKDARTPDLIVLPTFGTIFTTSKKKDAEHGGFSDDDTNVALLLAKPGFKARVIRSPVETVQVAPTILEALGIPADELRAVRIEETAALPGIDLD
jgi:hypothetical protein